MSRACFLFSLVLVLLVQAAACGESVRTEEHDITQPSDQTDSETGSDIAVTCGVTDLAPPSVELTDGVAVPIDIQQIKADVRLSITEQRARARSRLVFLLGPRGGFPVFDLRQSLISVELDGEPLDTALIERVEFASTDTGGVLLLHHELQPCTQHELVIEYEMTSPSGRSMLPYWGTGVFWNSAFGDGTPGMLLERWLPVGLIHDSFRLEMDVQVDGGDEHTFLANAPILTLDANHWSVSWDEADPSTPLWYLSRAEHILHWGDNRGMVDIYYAAGLFGPEQDEWLRTAEEAISEFTERFGVRSDHDRPFLLIVDPFQQLASGIEFANGAIVSEPSRAVLRHEILHAWLGRSVLPARHVDAWWDEGAVTFFSAEALSEIPFATRPLDPADPAAEPIAPSDPWTRGFPLTAYAIGGRVFATVVDILGRERVEGALRALVERCPHGHITNHDLAELIAGIGERDTIQALFASWVIPRGDPVVHGPCR